MPPVWAMSMAAQRQFPTNGVKGPLIQAPCAHAPATNSGQVRFEPASCVISEIAILAQLLCEELCE
eukprot:1273874-Amphidinium_carterae.1